MDSLIKILVIPKSKDDKLIKTHLTLGEEYNKELFVDIDYDPDIEDEKYFKQYDIVVYHELIGEGFGTKLKEMGIVGVLNIINPWTLKKDSLIYKYIKHTEKITKATIKDAEYITTSTEELKNKLSELVNSDKVFVNKISATEKAKFKKRKGRVRFGIILDKYDVGDYELIKGITTKLNASAAIGVVQIVLCGYDLNDTTTTKDSITGEDKRQRIEPKKTGWYPIEKDLTGDYNLVSDDAKSELLNFNGDFIREDEPYARITKKKNIDEYFEHFDVLLLPKKDVASAKYKAPKELIKCGEHNKAVVVSEIGLYSKLNAINKKFSELDESGLIFTIKPEKNHKDWVKVIKTILKNKNIIKNASKNLNKFILFDNNESKINKKLNDFYKKITLNK